MTNIMKGLLVFFFCFFILYYYYYIGWARPDHLDRTQSGRVRSTGGPTNLASLFFFGLGRASPAMWAWASIPDLV